MPKFPMISFDTECTGLDLHHGAKPFFITVCDTKGQVSYWEADVDPLTRQPKWDKSTLEEVAELLTNSGYAIVAQNVKFDVQALSTVLPGIAWQWWRTYDTLMAGHLLCSNQPHDLTTMAMIYLRLNIQPLEDALEVAVKEAAKIAKHKYPEWQLAKKGRDDMPSAKEKTWKYDSWLPRAVAQKEGYAEDHEWWSVLANYANGDSSVTLPLFEKQEALIRKQGLWSIYLERLKLLPVIYSMEQAGMTMSYSRTEELHEKLLAEAEECKRVCLALADNEIEDLPVNGMSNDLRYVLFDKFSLKSSKKTGTGKPSGDKFVLDHWITTLPENSKPWKFVNNLKRYRRRRTAVGYMESYEKFWLHLRNDIYAVYPSFNSTGTHTLRFSSQNPNAQQVSKQEEVNTRYCFGPTPGKEWWSVDFSNLELRIPAYEADEKEMVFLFEHPNDPPYYGSYHMMIFDTLHPEKFAQHGMECKKVFESTWYQWTKNGNFAIQYGAVEQSGTADKAYHVPGAQRRIMSRFTRIKDLSRKWIDFANKCGFVETVPDREVCKDRGYPLYCTLTNYGKILETVPLSYHVQGTAMWVTIKAMIRCHSYLQNTPKARGKIICQVHDEIIFEFPRGVGQHHIKALTRLMEMSGADIDVPLSTTISYHPVCWSLTEEHNVS